MKRRSLPHMFQPLGFFLLALSLFLAGAQHASKDKAPSLTKAVPASASYADIAVVRVYDGDTIKVANGEKVRLVGIDTPESGENKKLFRDAARSGQDIQDIMKMGRRASAFTKGLLDGRRVRLEFDIQQRDKYGRLLAYVYRVDDGLFINAEIVRSGYAYPMTIPPNVRHADEFKALFREARKAGKGLWADVVADGRANE
jgi:micrococcal nuclease